MFAHDDSPSDFSSAPSLNGRDLELARTRLLLKAGAVVTLWGPGGVGKTSILRACLRDLESLAEGQTERKIFSLDGSTIKTAEQLMSALSDLSGVRSSDVQALARAIDSDAAYFAIDDTDGWNEQALASLRGLCQSLSRTAVLITSRRPLSLANETVVQIQPFGPNSESALEIFEQALKRYARTNPLREEERVAAQRICELSMGMPFTIELCASACLVDPIEQVARDLERDFFSLDQEAAPHLSLAKMVERSFAHLSDLEAESLARLSVFPAKGFTLNDAEKATGLAPTELRRILQSLVRKSLAQREGELFQAYRILPEVSSYAQRALPLQYRAACELMLRAFAETHATNDLMYSATNCATPFFNDMWALLEQLQGPLNFLAKTPLEELAAETKLDLLVAALAMYFSGSTENARTWTDCAERLFQNLEAQLSTNQKLLLRISLARRQFVHRTASDDVLERIQQTVASQERPPERDLSSSPLSTLQSETSKLLHEAGADCRFALKALRALASVYANASPREQSELLKRAAVVAEEQGHPQHAASLYAHALSNGDFSERFEPEEYRILKTAAERCARQAGMTAMLSNLRFAEAKNHYWCGRVPEAVQVLRISSELLQSMPRTPWDAQASKRTSFCADVFSVRDRNSPLPLLLVQDGALQPIENSLPHVRYDAQWFRFHFALNLLHRGENALALLAFEAALGGAEREGNERDVALAYAFLGLAKFYLHAGGMGESGEFEFAAAREVAQTESNEVLSLVRAIHALSKSEAAKRDAMDEIATLKVEVADHLLILDTLRLLGSHEKRNASSAGALSSAPKKEDELFEFFLRWHREDERHWVTPQEVGAFLWAGRAEDDEAKLRNRIRVLVFKLRKRLASHTILVNDQGHYRLEERR